MSDVPLWVWAIFAGAILRIVLPRPVWDAIDLIPRAIVRGVIALLK